MRRTLTDKGVAALKPRPQRYAEPDPELVGHYVRVMPTGAKSFVTVARSPAGKQVWTTIGAADVMSIAEARERARVVIQRVRDGLPAVKPPSATFEDVARQWLNRHVRANGLRSERQMTRMLNAHVFPAWQGRAFLDIRRSDVVALLDAVEDDHGARQADAVLDIVRAIMNWYAIRTDGYAPPVVKGMRRTSTKARARGRILDDDELRAVWKAAESNGMFGAFVRIALLTAQRRTTIAKMRWEDVSVDGVWNIKTEAREKGTAGALVLPPVAVDVIRGRPHIADNPYVFAAAWGEGYTNGFSHHTNALKARLPAMHHWQLHDLRRTARSLMSRAGVRPDIAERVLGHAQPGVAGVYDRHSYRDEKADALRRLAMLVDSIVNPRDNVHALPVAQRRKRR
jgi:Arm DNA-binding domain/Phage integrase family